MSRTNGGRCGSWPPSAPRSDPGGGGPGHRIPCRARGSAAGTPIARPTPGWRSDPFWPGRRASAPAPSLRPDHSGASCAHPANTVHQGRHLQRRQIGPGGVAERERAAQSNGGRLVSPDLLQFQHQPRQHVTAVEAHGVLQPLRCRGHAGFRAGRPDLHGPLLRKQQPAQLGAIGLVERHLAAQGFGATGA